MSLTKQNVSINFSQGLETKVDPFQLPAGKFLSLENSIFDKAGRLTKRNGYGALSALPVTTTKSLTTFNGDLTSIGKELYAYSSGSKSWVNKGSLELLKLSTLSAIRNGAQQTQADAALAPNGLMCIAYTETSTGGTTYKYAVIDSVTGQSIVNPTLIPAQSGGTVTGSPRVFLVGSYFVIVYTNVITATSHLDYIAISIGNPSGTAVQGEIASAYVSASTLSWDGVVYSNTLYIGYNNTTGGQNIAFRTVSNNLIVSAAVTQTGEICTIMSMTVDSSNPSVPTVWAAYYDSAGSTGKVLALSTDLSTVLAPTSIISTGSYLNITSVAQSGSIQVFMEQDNNYSYDSSIPSHYIQTVSVTQAGAVGSITVVARSVGLASKAFLNDGSPYILTAYTSPFQPSYFLINGSTKKVVAKLAYSNGGGYYTTGLPSATNMSGVVTVPYLIKDLLQASNTTSTGSTPNVYSQTGVNIATFDFSVDQITSGEIGNNLNFSGGFVTSYDGVAPVEQGFFLWPDSVEATWSTTGGSVAAQPDASTNTDAYAYQVTYEWTDNQGNLFRSAPSIPIFVTTTGSGTTGSITLNIPTLRLTYKTATPVNIVIYRWSVGQQNYYQTTSITSPLQNDTTTDSVTYIDTHADSSILGNNLIYTTGGVLENVAPPATDNITLFDNRLFAVFAEDRNLLLYSKQVIESTPIEMSDLLTIYVAPSTASEGSTGPVTAFAPMDDKLVLFKENALGYISGRGPDNTGANNQYSDFTLINSVVGCTNQNSIVFTPQGLMFQSNKGIWLLGRDLSTNYIGAPVESLTTGAVVKSALNIPTTNQVRFTLDTGITLLFDYYYNQWGSFTNVPAVSSTVFQSLHTYVDSFGRVFQETPGVYLDNTSPVLMRFVTGWLNLAGLQGFERFYEMYLLGQYLSPFALNVQIAYDFSSSATQSTLVTPAQSSVNWGSDALWGSGAEWGSVGSGGWESQANVFEARVFPQRQKCESFQISMTEVFNGSIGTVAGAGLTLSGINLVVGAKRGFRTSKATRNFG